MADNDKEQEPKGQEFIREKIKDKPLGRRNIIKMCILAIVLGLLFGVTACLANYLLSRALSNRDSADKNDFVISESGDSQDTDESNEDSEPEVIVEQQQLEVQDYQKLQNKIYAIGKKANKSIVTVAGKTSETDIFDTDYENENKTSGLIIGLSHDRLMILTEYKSIEDASQIKVTFIDGASADAELINYDRLTGLAVIYVDYTTLSDDTVSSIAAATLDVTKQVKQGDVVIATGSPMGSVYSILFGSITSVANEISLDDSVYTIYTTNMLASSSSSGVLVNLDGEVVGITLMQYNNSSDQNTLTAIPVSELKGIIEKLSNDEDQVYLGVKVSTVTEDIIQEHGIPEGVYIRSVENDSPAFEAGLQRGDVIVAINDTEIKTVEDYMDYLAEKKPSQVIAITIMRQSKNEYKEVSCSAKLIKLQ